MTRCSTCGATYAPMQADSTRYFHQCPPLSDADIVTALGLNVDRAKWTAQNAADFAAASRVRPNARNENVPSAAVLTAAVQAANIPNGVERAKQVNAIRESAITAAGAGVTTVADVQAQQVSLG